MQNIKNLILVYTDEEGNSHEQYSCDLIESGTLIDAETGEDMVLVGFKVIG